MYKLPLMGGGPYTIELESGAFDTSLVFLDGEAKKVLAFNAGIAPGNKQQSRIDYTPNVDATFNIVVSTVGEGSTGAFRLTVQRYEAVKEKK